MFSFLDGSVFNLISVDLAEFSITVTNTTVPFIGYRQDGSTVMTSFKTDGLIDGPGGVRDFETFYFDTKDWSGLDRVEIPTYGWSLDNLVVSTIPEPATVLLAFVGGSLLWAARSRK